MSRILEGDLVRHFKGNLYYVKRHRTNTKGKEDE